MLGCIADDFTGATDLANNLVRSGMRVVQTIGIPSGPLQVEGLADDGAGAGAGAVADAVVIALKSRTVPPPEAVAQSLAALWWLKGQGASQICFKYCSTFDSTPRGNIGPVLEALMKALHTDFTIATPALPDNGRTVFKGYLFAGDGLLNESGMQNHPLTPMGDPNLVRVLQAQCRGRVGLMDYRVVAQGAPAMAQHMAGLRAEGVRVAIVDAICNEDLVRLGPALKALPLVTGGSGVALGLPQNFGLAPSLQASALPLKRGLSAVLAGSCSVATRRQVQLFADSGRPVFALDPLRIAAGEDLVAQALQWARPLLSTGPVLVYSSADASGVQSVQRQLGIGASGALVERTLAAIARGLVEAGVGQLVVAGGETSGACVQALDVKQMRIGPQIDPGVPWCYAGTAFGAIHLALKSGNFGTEDFFSKAFDRLA